MSTLLRISFTAACRFNKHKTFYLIATHLLLFVTTAIAQDFSGFKFGKVTQSDFALSAAAFDSGANAVIIADIGKVTFEGNDKGDLTMIFTRFRRIKIVNKNSIEKIGNQEIGLYHNEGNIERLSLLKASTFNLENGIITETKLDDKAIITEKYNATNDVKKFSLPALKTGSIFDLVYTIKTPFYFHLKTWSFQGEYPRLWSEFDVTIPPALHYVMKMQGETNFDLDTTKNVYVAYSIRETNGTNASDFYRLTGSSINKHWLKKNVASLHDEPFTTTLDNYYTRVSFQLDYIQWTDRSDRHDMMPNWRITSKKLLEHEDFGIALTRENNWMSDDLKNVLEGANSENEKAYRIFNYVRDNFSAVEKNGYSKNTLYTQNSLKEVFKSKQGNVAEINLLLTAMLRKAGIDADPVILSTRDNGIANYSYPLIDEYDYVICVASPGNTTITLDASQPFNGYGKLPGSCYNGWAHIINEETPLPMFFSADSIHENSLTSVLIFNDKGKSTGTLTAHLGSVESYNARRKISSHSLKEYEKDIQTRYGSDILIENFGIDSLRKYDFPLTVHYDINLKNLENNDILYFDPMLGEGYKKNPFSSMNRHYPVEIPYQIDETYTLTMEIPDGYQVDEMPKSARVAYNEDEGMFEYLIQKGPDNIQMRVRLKLNKAFFPAEEYGTLRDFFNFVVNKENEQIVFKKK